MNQQYVSVFFLILRYNLLFVAVSSFFAVSIAVADVPLIFKNCPAFKTVHGVTSTPLFDEDCQTAYIIPDSVGELEVVGASIQVSERLCAAIERAALVLYSEFEEKDTTRLDEVLVEEKLIEREIRRLKGELVTQDLVEEDVLSQLVNLKSVLGNETPRFVAKCEDVSPVPDGCFLDSLKIDKLQNRIEAKESYLRRITRERRTASAELVLAEDAFAELQEDREKVKLAVSDSSYERTEAFLLALRQENGATVSVSLRTNVEGDVRKLAASNRTSNITVKQMPYTSGGLFSVSSSNSRTDNIPGYMEINAPGLSIDTGGVLFTGAGVVQIKMDKVTACETFQGVDRTDPKFLKEAMAANVVSRAYLQYKAGFVFDASIKVNHARLYEMLVKTKSRNGLFRSKNVKEVTESLEGRKTIGIIVRDQGGVLQGDVAEALVEKLRQETIQSALDLLGAKYVGVNPDVNPASSSAGAPKVAEALRKCANQWCQAGAIVIDAAHAVFGGNDSIQSFVQSIDVTAEVNYSNTKAGTLNTDITFK